MAPSDTSEDPASTVEDRGVEDRGNAGAQTLLRGLDLLDAISGGPQTVAELSLRLGLTKSTTHRLASALVDRRFLSFRPREGYFLGPKLLELGWSARQQVDLTRTARPHLEGLSRETEDAVHLGILDGGSALYLDKVSGRRRINIGSRIGERQPLAFTGLGKALMLDMDEPALRKIFVSSSPNASGLAVWLERMSLYQQGGYAFDLEENEDQIRCVAAPIRGVDGAIAAAVSVSSAAQYMDDARMRALIPIVQDACRRISGDLGWRGSRD